MPESSLKVLQVCRTAMGGGAERIALTLHQQLRARGHQAWIAVGRGDPGNPEFLPIPNQDDQPIRGPAVGWGNYRLPPLIGPRLGRRIRKSLMRMHPGRMLDRYRGLEDFRFPGSHRILDLPPERPDIVHCHNLHGGYFDLRVLASLSHDVPVVLTLHDEWTFTGHCGYTMGCERWEVGCGSCPSLDTYPAIQRDASSENLELKRNIYARSCLFVITPSQWLMERARRSVLSAGIVDSMVIYNGIDQTTFAPGDRMAARQLVGLPEAPRMLLFAANAARRNMFKDYETVRRAAQLVAERYPSRPLLLVALGDTGPDEQIGSAQIRFIPYEKDQVRVAAYYQAADLYLHGARADNLPTTILEALSTGLPVVATAVGGIPEQVDSLAGTPGSWSGLAVGKDRATGVLVPPKDPESMAAATAFLLENDELRAQLSNNATAAAAARFDLTAQSGAIIHWYRQVMSQWQAKKMA